jgi:hypothetical protein
LLALRCLRERDGGERKTEENGKSKLHKPPFYSREKISESVNP